MKSAFRAPSNIALVKYWGKYGVQLPSNPSISFTLDACATETTLELTGSKGIQVALDGVDTPSFVPKVAQFVERAATRHPWLKDYGLNVQTHNSFPHSSGIASSASGMSALALCVVDLAQQLGHPIADPRQEASVLARLGSGSACRSVYGGLVVWGETASVPGSSQDYGVEYPHAVHEVFRSYRDVVALVDVGQKAVSSTAGHQLMEQHPFRTQRFAQAHDHLAALGPILASGDLDAFIELVELEALTLHGLMMSSSPSYILMRPNTLQIIEAIRGFRRETGTPISFTLDAGANVHILFPAEFEQTAMDFVKEHVLPRCKDGRAIADRVGQGPVPLQQ
ncbi:MAG: diphosphomevalonate/mevalonate 3,5-bisphosphate decarboxylase family protein [Schleiferiaceae bacterium]